MKIPTLLFPICYDFDKNIITVGSIVEVIDDSGMPMMRLPFCCGERITVQKIHKSGNKIMVCNRFYFSKRFRVFYKTVSCY